MVSARSAPERFPLSVEADEHQEVLRGLGHLQALLLHFLRQERRGRLQLVLHLHLGNVGVRALLKGEVIVTVPAEDDEDEK
jgi:hypothetical protein